MTQGTKQSTALFVQAASIAGAVPPDGLESHRGQDGFLPFAASTIDQATYLRQFVEQGGKAVRDYKARSYRQLGALAGMRVLEVGCGIGADLIPLARRVGKHGLVTGLDVNADHLREAKARLARRSNVTLVQGNVEQMPFDDCTFDRVRADRVLLHIHDLHRALAEMGRVLRPGGIFAAVEPDWGSLAFYPGSPSGGDDDHTWCVVVQAIQRRLAHALIGRQLASLFQRDAGRWAEVHIEASIYILRSWRVVDTVLKITQAVQALAQEDAAFAHETNAWLQTVEAASQRGEFCASLPLFFARARKGESR